MIRKVIFFHFCKEIMRRSNNTNEQKLKCIQKEWNCGANFLDKEIRTCALLSLKISSVSNIKLEKKINLSRIEI